jgi:hypothetical protein
MAQAKLTRMASGTVPCQGNRTTDVFDSGTHEEMLWDRRFGLSHGLTTDWL